MRASLGQWVVRGILLLVAYVAWRGGVFFQGFWFFAGVIVGAVGGVASVWVAQRFRVEG
jgi:membrane protein YdbS with pleckstrin-like domain